MIIWKRMTRSMWVTHHQAWSYGSGWLGRCGWLTTKHDHMEADDSVDVGDSPPSMIIWKRMTRSMWVTHHQAWSYGSGWLGRCGWPTTKHDHMEADDSVDVGDSPPSMIIWKRMTRSMWVTHHQAWSYGSGWLGRCGWLTTKHDHMEAVTRSMWVTHHQAWSYGSGWLGGMWVTHHQAWSYGFGWLTSAWRRLTFTYRVRLFKLL